MKRSQVVATYMQCYHCNCEACLVAVSSMNVRHIVFTCPSTFFNVLESMSLSACIADLDVSVLAHLTWMSWLTFHANNEA